MTTELSIRPDQGKFDDTQRAALEALGIADAPEGDQQLFLHVAQRSGLDPFAKQIYLIPRWDGQKRKNKWTIQTSIDGLRVIRDRIGKFQGLTTEWCSTDGIWKDVWLSKQKPAAARVSVYVTGFQVPIRGIALWDEYVQTTKEGNVTSMWNSKSTVMIAKCAEAIAYRQAFPQDFSGLYVAEEMPAREVEQDHDGPVVGSVMRSNPNQNPGSNDARGRANETQVTSASEEQRTRPAATGKGRGRPESPAATPTTPARDQAVVAAEWAERIRETRDLRALFALHDEAANRGVLDHKPFRSDGKSLTVEELFLDRRNVLQQAAAGEPEPTITLDGPESVYEGDDVPF